MQKDFNKNNSKNVIAQNETKVLLTKIKERVQTKSQPEETSSPPDSDNTPEKEHFLFVGSSIGHNLNFPLLEHQNGAKISKAKAYTAVKDDMPNSFKAPFPGKNFSTVVPAELSKKQYKVLFLQGGSTEVSNLKTNSILLVDEYKETIKQASENIFKVAEDAIKKSPSLEKVIIFERIPRHDADQHGLKSELSKYGNQAYHKLWSKSIFKDKIVIGEHNLDFTGNLKEKIYGVHNFDGIHMRGPLGFKFYTRSVLNIISKASLCKISIPEANILHPSGRTYQSRRYEQPQKKNVQPEARSYQSQNEYNHPSGRKHLNQKEHIQPSGKTYQNQKECIHPSGRSHRSRNDYTEQNYQQAGQQMDSQPSEASYFSRGKVSEDQYSSYNIKTSSKFPYSFAQASGN